MSDWIRELKSRSTAWAKESHDSLSNYSWQAGYGVFSVDQARVGSVIEYITNQEAHHRTRSFQDEFRQLLREQGLEWNEQYVWD